MTKKGKKFYAVKRGHKPGIYSTWEGCKEQTDGFSSTEYKGFFTRKDAEDYLNGSAKGLHRDPEGAVNIESAVTIPLFLPASKRADMPMKQIVIYADGACTGNPGPGGYGVVIAYGERRRELSAGFRLTTNNRMEILGCTAGLLALKELCEVTIYSDSRYVVNTMTKAWALRWRRNGWKRKDKEGQQRDVLNRDLWIQMLALCDKHHVKFEWVRGHSGIEGNERCDQLARTAAASNVLGIDAAYEDPAVNHTATMVAHTHVR